MNSRGIEYVKNAPSRTEFKDEMVVERMMRCGREYRAFEIDNEDDLRSVALATLRYDLEKIEQSL